MKVEVGIVRWEEVDLIEALEKHLICWDYDIVASHNAERYYPAEKDDIFIEIYQETTNTWDGSVDSHPIAWLECSSYDEEFSTKKGILKYIKENIDRVIDISKTGGYW